MKIILSSDIKVVEISYVKEKHIEISFPDKGELLTNDSKAREWFAQNHNMLDNTEFFRNNIEDIWEHVERLHSTEDIDIIYQVCKQAVRLKHVGFLHFLLNKFPSLIVEEPVCNNETLLGIAIANNDYDCIEELIHAGVDINNVVNDLCTDTLEYALDKGCTHSDILILLAQNGAIISIDILVKAALYSAKLCKALLEHGCNYGPAGSHEKNLACARNRVSFISYR